MKYLLVLAIAFLVIWIWKSNRRADIASAAKPPRQQRKPELVATEIVACEVCHVHLPRSEALAGPGGVYCSEAHRQEAGR
ncbi:MAG: hypothetical protein JWQ72_2431 [Polaromonas sp.]|nr:hypothetical protein [Polaromonas sp.]